MSAPFGSLVLTLDDITRYMRGVFEGFTDPRKGKNTIYTVTDAALSAFSVFFMQSPSFSAWSRHTGIIMPEGYLVSTTSLAITKSASCWMPPSPRR